jgi:superfamily I DNA/RNA helicase
MEDALRKRDIPYEFMADYLLSRKEIKDVLYLR